MIVKISDNRICRNCKHRIKTDWSELDKCGIYAPAFKGDELLVSRKDKVRPEECPLDTCIYGERGIFYFKRKIGL